MKISAVFFDFDGVLTTQRSGSQVTNSYISEKTGVAYGEFVNAMKPRNMQLLLGEVTHREIWEDVCAELAIDIPFTIFQEAFRSTIMNWSIIDIARRLSERYYVGVITDNKKDRIDYLVRYHQLDQIFRTFTISSEVGALKTSAKPFLEAIKRKSLAYEECIFIDNNKANLQVPRSLGIHTVFHDDEVNDSIGLEKKLRDEYLLVLRPLK